MSPPAAPKRQSSLRNETTMPDDVQTSRIYPDEKQSWDLPECRRFNTYHVLIKS